MKPLYSSLTFWEYTWAPLSFVLLLFCTAAVLEWEEFRNLIVYSGTELVNDALWLVLPDLAFLFLFVFIIISVCAVRTVVYPDKIVIQKSLLPIFLWTISRDSIVAIQVSEMPWNAFVPKEWYNLGGTEFGPDWRVAVMSEKQNPLLIQTKQRKYMISCKDPEKAAEIIRREYGVPDGPVTPPPPTWDDR